jgi:predicted metal-dependent hydrolase
MISTLTVDDLQFEVRWSDQRRTVGLTVDREGELVISASTGCDAGVLETFVREKRFWLYTKLAEKEALKEEVRPRQFVGGEGFPYLGRSYRLRLVDEQDVPLKLEHGRFHLRRNEASDGRRAFIRWYTARGKPRLDRRVTRFVPRDMYPNLTQ